MNYTIKYFSSLLTVRNSTFPACSSKSTRQRCVFPFLFDESDDAVWNRRCAKNKEVIILRSAIYIPPWQPPFKFYGANFTASFSVSFLIPQLLFQIQQVKLTPKNQLIFGTQNIPSATHALVIPHTHAISNKTLFDAIFKHCVTQFLYQENRLELYGQHSSSFVNSLSIFLESRIRVEERRRRSYKLFKNLVVFCCRERLCVPPW